MKISAIHLRTCAASAAILTAIAGLAIASPAAAQDQVLEPDPSVRDVALTPLNDLNLANEDIPPALLEAKADPYEDVGIANCMDIRRLIGDLDAVLGDDFDTRQVENRSISATGVAQKVIATFIPFRGIIRELSGANAHELEYREAVAAGLMRRAYLKGMGQMMDCPYPARPAKPALLAQMAERHQEVADSYIASVTLIDEDGSTYQTSARVDPAQ